MPSGAVAAAAMQLGTQAASGIAGLIGAKKQHKRNLELAQFQADANERYLQQQLEWDSPVNQMKRYKEAGLNPHLVYGQGTPGNQGQPLRYPDIRPTDWQSIAPQAIQLGNQTALAMSQVQAVNAKTEKDTAQTQVAKIQAEVLRRNPLLDDAGFKATIDSLVGAAQSKSAQGDIDNRMASWLGTKETKHGKYNSNMWHKLNLELELLNQKFDLGTQDAQVKANIVKSKEFQNAILEVQKKWLTDADITPQHIYQFIQMLLMKML